jgi:hypothetical protein
MLRGCTWAVFETSGASFEPLDLAFPYSRLDYSNPFSCVEVHPRAKTTLHTQSGV